MRFKFFEHLSLDQLPIIGQFLGIQEMVTRLSLVSKTFNQSLVPELFSLKHKGAKNYDDFITRMKRLPPKLRQLIFLKNSKYTLPCVEQIAAIFSLPIEDRLSMLLTPQQIDTMPGFYLEALSSENGILALSEGLLTLDQARDMSSMHIREITTDLGILALREGLITLEQIRRMPLFPHMNLSLLLSGNGLLALREKLITPKQACIPFELLSILLSDNGIRALRNKQITIEEAKNFVFDYKCVSQLVSDKGIALIKEGLITPTKAEIIRSSKCLETLMTENGIRALGAGYIKPEHVAMMYYNNEYLKELITEDGITALQDKLITPELAAMMSSSYRIAPLINVLRQKLIPLELITNKTKSSYIDALLTRRGILVLSEGLITLQEAFAMPHCRYLSNLMWGIQALREKLITPKQAAILPHHEYISVLLTDEGMLALREKRITPEQAAEMAFDDLWDTLKIRTHNRLGFWLDHPKHLPALTNNSERAISSP